MSFDEAHTLGMLSRVTRSKNNNATVIASAA